MNNIMGGAHPMLYSTYVGTKFSMKTGYGNEVTIYLRQIVFYGDLRDFEAKDCKIIREWWKSMPEKLGQHCWIRDAVLNVRPGNGKRFTLTQNNMKDNGHII